MAAASSFNEGLGELLVCNICLQRLENAKSLSCNDSFCKPCLDSLLQFRPDGSASISCPLGCNEQTEIGADKTTNDLDEPSHFKNIVDFLDDAHDGENEKRRFIRCHEYPKCDKIITVSCPVCFVKLCTSCRVNHKHEEVQNSRDIEFVPVKFKQGSAELLPWCEEHATYATYFCQEGFICVYCKARSHATHRCDTIATLSHEIEEWVQKQEPQLPDLEYRITSSKQKSDEELYRIKKGLAREIKRRKYIAIQEYLKKLSEEEDRIFDQLESAMTRHFASYPLCKPSGYIKKKPKFEVFANKDFICQSVENVTSQVVVVPSVTFTFSVETMNETHPLGLLEELVGAAELTEGLVTVSSVITEGEMTNKCLRTQTEDLKSIREEFELKDESQSDEAAADNDATVKEANVGDEERFEEILREYERKENAQAKMSYLCEFIAADDIAGFKFMWNTIPHDLLHLQHNGYNMLHFAATFDKPEFAQVVLEAGMDINKNKDGVTALLMATAFGNLSTVQMLVERDADILIKKVEVNAIDVAKMVYNPGIVEYLSNHLKKCRMKDTGMLSEKNFEKTLRALAIIRDRSGDDDNMYMDSDDDFHSISDYE